jgi:2-polyprenyl-3-methyl-5-hydroxy-6-metoxy-1,4-benzoquinol methylase
MHPIPPRELLVEHYNSIYRESEYAIKVSGRFIDLPIQFPQSAQSFRRFTNMLRSIEAARKNVPGVVPTAEDTIIDIGGYQGMFLHAAVQAYGVEGVVVDFNEQGIEFAKKALGFSKSRLITNVLDYEPDQPARFVSMIHSFEHMPEPVAVLRRLKNKVLQPDGFLYIEVPNLFGSPLNDPTHLFTFSRESLTYLLNMTGFAVLEMHSAGNDMAPLTIATDELVLVCLAQSVGNPPKPTPSRQGATLVNAVQRNYNRLTRIGIRKQLVKVLKETAKLMYYATGHFFLEKLPIDLHDFIGRLKRRTNMRIH